jgi:GT2 family glycosyltransferase
MSEPESFILPSDSTAARPASPRLFIGIPCYQESDRLRQTLEYLRERTVLPHTIEVHVAKQSVVKNKNALLEKARASGAQYICLCDDDIEPELAWDRLLIEKLEEEAARSGRPIGQTAPRFVFPNGRIFWAWFNFFCDPDLKLSYSYPPGHRWPDHPRFQVVRLAPLLVGTLSIFTRECLDKLNWHFDERYEKSQWEDLDQSLECRSAGYDVLYNGQVKVVHHSVGANPRALYRNRIRFETKWGQRTDLAMIITPYGRVRYQSTALMKSWPVNVLIRRRPIDRLIHGWKFFRKHGVRHYLRMLVRPLRRGERVAAPSYQAGLSMDSNDAAGT